MKFLVLKSIFTSNLKQKFIICIGVVGDSLTDGQIDIYRNYWTLPLINVTPLLANLGRKLRVFHTSPYFKIIKAYTIVEPCMT